MLCAIWYHLHNLKNVKNTHEAVLLLVKLKLTLLLGCFSDFLKLYKRYKIVQRITYMSTPITLSLQYQVEISVAMSGKVIARVMNFINDLTDGDRFLGGWKKLR